MKYNFIILFLCFSIFISFNSVSAFEISPFDFDYPPAVFNNNTAFVNASSNWITQSLGALDDANSTQMENNVGELNIKQSWLTSLLGTIYCKLTGCSMTGNINMGGFNITNADTYFGKGDALTLKTISGSSFSTIQELQNVFHSSGVFNDNVSVNFVNVSGNSFNVTAGRGTIRSTNNATDTIFFFDWVESLNNPVGLDEVIFIGVEWNSGSPQVVLKSTNTWDMQTDFPLASVIRDASGVHLQREDHSVGDHANNMIQRVFSISPLARGIREGGLIIGTSGRNITVTTGVLWEKLNKFTIPAIDTSGTDVFDRYYRNGTGGWFVQTQQTTWNNTHFDDGTGTLNELGNNKFSVEWVYLEVDGEIVTLYGQEEFNNIGDASGSSPPSSIPPRVEIHSKLIGRIIFQKDTVNSSSTESVFTTTFTVAGVTDHGNLAGLEGDDHIQYFLVDGSSPMTGNADWGGFNLTNIGLINFTTNTITDGVFSGDWDFGVGDVTLNIIKSSGAINFQPDNDIDDFIIFQTPNNVPTITTAGNSNLNINSASGLINFGDENLLTTGIMTTPRLQANGIQLFLTAGTVELSFEEIGVNQGELVPSTGDATTLGSISNPFSRLYISGIAQSGSTNTFGGSSDFNNLVSIIDLTNSIGKDMLYVGRAGNRSDSVFWGRVDNNGHATATSGVGGQYFVTQKTTANMIDNFGTGIVYKIGDVTQGLTNIAKEQYVRDGADNSGKYELKIWNVGSGTTVFQIDSSSRVFFPGVPNDVNASASAPLFIQSSDGQLVVPSSSIIFKKNIVPASNPEKFYDIDFVNFEYIRDKSNTIKTGVIAENMTLTYPELMIYNYDKVYDEYCISEDTGKRLIGNINIIKNDNNPDTECYKDLISSTKGDVQGFNFWDTTYQADMGILIQEQKKEINLLTSYFGDICKEQNSIYRKYDWCD